MQADVGYRSCIDREEALEAERDKLVPVSSSPLIIKLRSFVKVVEMSIGDDIIEKHRTAMEGALEKLLSGIAQGGDIQADANIAKMMEINLSLIRQHAESCSDALKELQTRNPSLTRQVSVNVVKRERVEKSNRAVSEREEKKLELMRRLKALRKNIPVSMRDQLNAATVT